MVGLGYSCLGCSSLEGLGIVKRLVSGMKLLLGHLVL